MMDGIPWSRPRAAVIPGHEDHLSSRLGHARRHGSHARLGNELHGDPCLLIGIFQVINQFRQILDGINIVVGRGRDQAHAGRGMPCLSDPRINLAAGQMTALPRLCPLRHLNLDLLRAYQIAAGHAEPSAGHLLDRRAAVQAVLPDAQPLQILSPFAGIGFPMEPVHGDRHRLMGFFGNGAIGHSARLKPGDNGFHALHFLQRNAFLRIVEVHQPPQVFDRSLVIHQRRILPEHPIIAPSGGFLEQMDRGRVVKMFFRAAAHLMMSQAVQRQIRFQPERVEGPGVQFIHLFFNFF